MDIKLQEADEKRLTDSSEVYRDLKARLVGGQFIQGSRLRPERLRDTYDCSATTLREVFLRLAANGILDALPQRGFRVPRTSPAIRNDLIDLRVLIEQHGARLSIANGDVEWEANLAGSHHKLARIEMEMRNTKKIVPLLSDWNKAELEFHKSLISACGSQLLIETHENIFDRFRMHLLSDDTRRGVDEEGEKEHKAILDTALNRDAEKCCEVLFYHINKNFAFRSKYLLAESSSG